MPVSPLLLTKNELKIISLQDELEKLKEMYKEATSPLVSTEEDSLSQRTEKELDSNMRRMMVPLLFHIRSALQIMSNEGESLVAGPLREAEGLLVKGCVGSDDESAVESALAVLHGRLSQAPYKVELPKFIPHTLNPLAGENSRLLSSLFRNRGTISVYCRIRPLNSAENVTADAMMAAQVRAATSPGSPASVSSPSWENHVDSSPRPLTPRMVVEGLSDTEASFWSRAIAAWRPFAFDRVFGPDSRQIDVAEEAYPLAAAVLEGYKACILAYGVTGSGKTHSMMGPPNDPGLIVRTMGKLFQMAESRAGSSQPYVFSMSMLEIYNEQLRDLLCPLSTSSSGLGPAVSAAPPHLEIRDGPSPGGGPPITIVHGLSSHPVGSLDEVLSVLSRGLALRATAPTSIHASSSRSHCVVRVDVTGAVDSRDGESTMGRLYLVDLAGSERVQKSEVRGPRLREAQAINRSLSALGDTLEALDKKSPHIPYRNSRLTRLLQDALGGAARTLLVATVGPSHTTAEETLCTLQFASRARRVDLGPAHRAVNFKNLSHSLASAEAAYSTLAAKERERVGETLLLRSQVKELSASVSENEAVKSALTETWQKRVQLEKDRVRHLGGTLLSARSLYSTARGNLAKASREARLTQCDPSKSFPSQVITHPPHSKTSSEVERVNAVNCDIGEVEEGKVGAVDSPRASSSPTPKKMTVGAPTVTGSTKGSTFFVPDPPPPPSSPKSTTVSSGENSSAVSALIQRF